MNTGQIISGIGHGALICWALVGGLFLRSHEVPPASVAEVSVISEEEFAALTAPQTPPQISPEPPSNEPPAPDAAPQRPVTAETKPETPAPKPAEPAPEPEAVPATRPEPLPPQVVQDETAPEAPEPPAPDPGAQVEAKPNLPPKPKPAPRIAPEATPEKPPEAVAAPEPVPDKAPAETPVETVEEQKPPAAPEEATTEIVTEAEKPAPAPTVSIRPKSRPPKPAAVAEAKPDPKPKPAVERPDAKPQPDALDAALAEALGGAGTAEEKPPRPSGPPLTSGEKGEFALAVRKCWVVDPGSESARVTVDIGFEMSPDGKPVSASLRMVRATEGSDAAVKSAFEAGRRAILRCGAAGFDLPREKYEQWRNVEISFNPENMRIR